jgi:cysteine synthase
MPCFNNILETIGNTPMIRLNALAPEHVNLFVKVESFNPMGSVKDRMAQAVIEAAERSGELRPGQTVIEATSGNTGIGLAMVCAQKGYPLIVVMAENFSIERRRLMRFLGAKVVLTPAAEKGTGMLGKAEELARTHGHYLCRQFENEANANVHFRTTAQEILDDMGDKHLDYWVSGFGTGGTLKGVAQRLKADSPETRIVVAEPDNSQLLGSHIPQPRDEAGRPCASHPNFRPHTMQGWSPDFISRLTESAMESSWVDEIVPVAGEEGLRLARELARQEGMLVGISSGGTLAAALEIAHRAEPGSNILCMAPDTGERYMSTPLFDDIAVEMSEEELAISHSTPSARFLVETEPEPEPEKPASPRPPPAVHDPEARRFVDDAIANNAVVMFSLEWCEFCWAVRKLFSAMGVAYHSVDLDSVAYQENNKGGQIRQVLASDLGVGTIPQLYIGAEPIGGASELFAAFASGELQERLVQNDIDFDDSKIGDAMKFMPQWLQPRKSA